MRGQRRNSLFVGALAVAMALAPARVARGEWAGDDEVDAEAEEAEAREEEAEEPPAEEEPEPPPAEEEPEEYFEASAETSPPAEPVDRGGGAEGRRGISPRWFWAAVAVGVGLGAGAAITGGYTLSLNSQYLEDPSDPLLRERGMSLQLATNVLLGAAGGVALVALLVGIFTDWSSLRPSREEPGDEEGAMFTHLGDPSRALGSEEILAQRLGHCCRP